MSGRRVNLSASAERDLSLLVGYIAEGDSLDKAEHVLGKLTSLIESLAEHAELGVVVNELRAIGITQYQQLVWKPYRVVYEIVGDTVFVMVIADGRRDMQTLLQQRLLT